MSEHKNASTKLMTIISLIGQFKQEKSGSKSTDFESFQQWLVSNDHYDILAVLKGNAKAIAGIKKVLQEDKLIIEAKLNRLDLALSAFATTVKGFDQIALAFSPNIILSESAQQALKKFDKNESTTTKSKNNYDDRPSSIDLEDLAEPIASGKEIISDEDLSILDY